MQYFRLVIIIGMSLFLSGCIGVAKFDENGFENITFNLNCTQGCNLNITMDNGTVWQKVNQLVELVNHTDNMTIDSDFTFVTGNMSVFELDIRSPNSLTFDIGKYTLSAEDFVFPGVPMVLTNVSVGIRRQIVSDSDFQVRHNLSNGTAYLSVFNPSRTPLSKSSINGINSDRTGFTLIKSNSLAIEPNIFELQNNGGFWDIIQGPMKPNNDSPFIGKSIRIGFYDNFTVDENLSIISFNNKTYIMTINQTAGVNISSDLVVEGNLIYNEIFGELYFAENGDLNITINTINTYENITNLLIGYTNSVQTSDSKFIIQENGTYFTSFNGALIDGSTSDYGISLFVNEQEQNRTHAHMTTVTSSRYTNFGGQGTFLAVEGDIISLRVQDESNPASDADFNNIDFIIRRIGK